MHLTLGDSLVGEGEYGRGRTEYESAADLIRAEGSFPSVALRRIADSYYFQGMYRRAIAALDQLACDASEVGDIVTQASAVADAVALRRIEKRAHPLHQQRANASSGPALQGHAPRRRVT